MKKRTIALSAFALVMLCPFPRADDKTDNAKARAQAAHKAYGVSLVQLRDGKGMTDPEKIYRLSRRWMEAEQDLAQNAEDKVAAEAHQKRMADFADRARNLFEAGSIYGGGDSWFRVLQVGDRARRGARQG